MPPHGGAVEMTSLCCTARPRLRPPPYSRLVPRPRAHPGAQMTRFRPCIDLHAGQVKQIVGGTLATDLAALRTNHVSAHAASHFAALYKDRDLRGGHVI